MSRTMWFALLAIQLFLLPAPDAAGSDTEAATIILRGETAITGNILYRKADGLVVDLGFEILWIPMAAVERIEAIEPPTEQKVTGDLYHMDPGRRELTVRANVARCGEAVLEIRTPTGIGSGFLIHPDGYAVTAHHVISNEHDITVTLFEETGVELRRTLFKGVRIVAFNPHTDLALLKIDTTDGRALPYLPLGDSRALVQGQAVFSIGSPLGLDRSVAEGIVSLKNRPLGGHLYIQSTVQINPGNSGGPLLNLRGELIGVNNMKVATTGVEGLSFAIPSRSLIDFLANRDAFAFDPRNPNAGFRYHSPAPAAAPIPKQGDNP